MTAGKVLTVIATGDTVAAENDIITIDPAAAQMIETTDTVGDKLASSGLEDEKVTLIGVTGTKISILGKTGTWIDAN